MTGKTLLDCHVHLAALPDGDNGCDISPTMLRSPLFRFLLWKHQIHPDKPQEANRKYLDDLLGELRTSRHVQQAVLLGMDGGLRPERAAQSGTHGFPDQQRLCAQDRASPCQRIPDRRLNQ